MLDELNETTTVPFGYFWEPNPLEPAEPALMFVAPSEDLCWRLEFHQALTLIATQSQEMAWLLRAHQNGRKWAAREVGDRLAPHSNSYEIKQPWWRRWMGR